MALKFIPIFHAFSPAEDIPVAQVDATYTVGLQQGKQVSLSFHWTIINPLAFLTFVTLWLQDECSISRRHIIIVSVFNSGIHGDKKCWQQSSPFISKEKIPRNICHYPLQKYLDKQLGNLRNWKHDCHVWYTPCYLSMGILLYIVESCRKEEVIRKRVGDL